MILVKAFSASCKANGVIGAVYFYFCLEQANATLDYDVLDPVV